MADSDTTKADQGHETATLRRRLLIAAIAMVAIYFLGTAGYYFLGGGRWPISDCSYMTVISLTTVGYGEVLPGLDHVPHARLFTATLIISGAVIALYFVSVLTTFLVEGEFLHLRRRKKMRKKIDRLEGHIIVCGAGRTGSHIVEELHRAHWPFVVVDNHVECIERCEGECGGEVLYLLDDATDDAVLLSAGIKRAHGIVAALADDQDNLYVVLTARGLNPDLRIVSKAVDHRAGPKLRVAGADSVVTVNQIGGLRLASEMIRPEVVGFLDDLVRQRDKNLRFEEVTIPAGSALVGQRLAQTDIRKERNLLIVAASAADSSAYTYSPGPSYLLCEGMTLILLGETESIDNLRKALQSARRAPPPPARRESDYS